MSQRMKQMNQLVPQLAPGYTPPTNAFKKGYVQSIEKHVLFLDPNDQGSSSQTSNNRTTQERRKLKAKASEPPKYTGTKPAEEWLDMVICAADSNGWPVDETLVKQVSTYLQGKALSAYKLLINQNRTTSSVDPGETFRLQDGTYVRNITWSDFVDHMKSMFPRNVSQVDSKIILDERKQRKGESFSSYAVDKLALCLEHDEDMSEKTKTLNLIAGAFPLVKEKLEDKEEEIFAKNEDEIVAHCLALGNKYTRTSGNQDLLQETKEIHEGLLAAAKQMNENAKSIIINSNSGSMSRGRGFRVNNGYRETRRGSNSLPRQANNQQYRQNNLNPRWQSNTRWGNRDNYPRVLKCWNCDEPTHLMRNCPHPRKATISPVPPPSYPSQSNRNSFITMNPSAPNAPSPIQGN